MIRMQHLVLILLTAIFAVPVFTQDTDPIRVETNLVNVNVSVSDKKGNYVLGLEKENFEIYDEAKKMPIEYFSAGNEPVSYGIVYDMHPTTEDRTKAVLESLREFTRGLGKQDDFFTLVFNKRGSLVLNFVPTAEQVRIHLSSGYSEPNALYDAIYMAAKTISNRRNNKRVLLVITDSADHNSEHSLNDIQSQLREVDAQVYTVIWDEAEKWEYSDITSDGVRRNKILSDATSLSRGAMQELALRTGGIMQSPVVQNANELFRIYDQINTEVRRQYSLGFYPETFDGKWHSIKVKLRSVENTKGMSLTHRLGYKSPDPK
ncbi:MAG: VWA domain-containing protein [Pyrinomonadaceae bacterium]